MNIKKIRKKYSDYTQSDMALRLGMSTGNYAKKERGEIPFFYNELLAIAKYLAVPVGVLFGEPDYRDLQKIISEQRLQIDSQCAQITIMMERLKS